MKDFKQGEEVVVELRGIVTDQLPATDKVRVTVEYNNDGIKRYHDMYVPCEYVFSSSLVADLGEIKSL